MTVTGLLVLTAMGSSMSAVGTTLPAGLDESSFGEYKAFMQPRSGELDWQEIPWRTTLWSAVQEAARQDRPILLWAMNGHPMACT